MLETIHNFTIFCFVFVFLDLKENKILFCYFLYYIFCLLWAIFFEQIMCVARDVRNIDTHKSDIHKHFGCRFYCWHCIIVIVTLMTSWNSWLCTYNIIVKVEQNAIAINLCIFYVSFFIFASIYIKFVFFFELIINAARANKVFSRSTTVALHFQTQFWWVIIRLFW